MKIVGNTIIYFTLFVIFTFSGLGDRSGFTHDGFLLALLIGLPFLLIGCWFVSQHEGNVQTSVNKGATEILDQIRDSQPVNAFFLYLRPFSSTNAYRLANDHLNLFSWELWERDGFDDLERVLSRTLRPTAEFIALGNPGEHRGAGKVLTTEDEWRQAVSMLMRAARLIIVIPSHQAGTLWELNELKRQGHLSKSIFIAPPLDSAFFIPCAEENVLQNWEKTQTACKEIGLALPKSAPDGVIFKLNPSGDLECISALPHPDPVAWMKAIQVIINSSQTTA